MMNSLKKKHREFVAVIIDHSNARVLDILESRDKDRIVIAPGKLGKGG